MSLISAGLALLKADLAIDEIPVLQNALAIYQKTPNALGKAMAVQSLIANAPAAALSAETDTVNELLLAVNTDLVNLATKAQADLAAAKAQLSGGAAAVPASTKT